MPKGEYDDEIFPKRRRNNKCSRVHVRTRQGWSLEGPPGRALAQQIQPCSSTTLALPASRAAWQGRTKNKTGFLKLNVFSSKPFIPSCLCSWAKPLGRNCFSHRNISLQVQISSDTETYRGFSIWRLKESFIMIKTWLFYLYKDSSKYKSSPQLILPSVVGSLKSILFHEFLYYKDIKHWTSRNTLQI